MDEGWSSLSNEMCIYSTVPLRSTADWGKDRGEAVRFRTQAVRHVPNNTLIH